MLAYPAVSNKPPDSVGTCSVFKRIEIGELRIVGVQVEDRGIASVGGASLVRDVYRRTDSEAVGLTSDKGNPAPGSEKAMPARPEKMAPYEWSGPFTAWEMPRVGVQRSTQKVRQCPSGSAPAHTRCVRRSTAQDISSSAWMQFGRRRATYSESVPTIAATRGEPLLLAVDNNRHSHRSIPDGRGIASGWVCHSPR